MEYKKFPSIHDRLALERNRCLQRAHVPEWMTKGKTTIIEKDPFNETDPTTTSSTLPTDNVENINSTKNGRDLLGNRKDATRDLLGNRKDATRDPEAQKSHST